MHRGTRRELGLQPYAQCPLGTSASCDFSLLRSEDACGAAIYRCGACGHGVTRPAMADVSHLYEGRESQDYQRADGSISELIKRAAFRRQARRLMRALPAAAPEVIVDFACGSGLFTSMLSEELQGSAEIHALDFFDEPPRDMGRVRYRSFSNMKPLLGRADLLLCFHALEHDDNPHAFLGRLLPLLRPGGLLVVEVPNIDCIWAPAFGTAWDNWYLPYHRLHFSRRSLRALIEKEGLEVVREDDVSVPSIGRSLARSAGSENRLPFLLAGIALHPIQLIGEKLSRRPSALRIIARKPRG